MQKRITYLLTLLLLIVVYSTASAGWFSETHYYIVVQKDAEGNRIQAWTAKGSPQAKDGIWTFYDYPGGREVRIPVTGTVITDIGTKPP